jgi:hypothetical protein
MKVKNSKAFATRNRTKEATDRTRHAKRGHLIGRCVVLGSVALASALFWSRPASAISVTPLRKGQLASHESMMQ